MINSNPLSLSDLDHLLLLLLVLCVFGSVGPKLTITDMVRCLVLPVFFFFGGKLLKRFLQVTGLIGFNVEVFFFSPY